MTRIFDNIDLSLGPHLIETLSGSNRMDAAIGYFNIRGWKPLGDVIDDRQPTGAPIVRLLIGMVHEEPDSQVLDHLQRTLAGASEIDTMDRRAAIARREQSKLKFRQQLMRGAPTKSDQATIQRLRQHITDGRVAIKLFTRRPLHGKTYLFHRSDKITPTVAYVGSSNLTLSGLAHNYELNVDVVDSDGAAKLNDWFEERWNDKFTLDITEDGLSPKKCVQDPRACLVVAGM